MTTGKPERRSQRRIAHRTKVAIQSCDGQSAGQTRDLHSSGIFLYTDSQLREGSKVELVLVLPPELTGGARRWACCQASVVRLESSGPDGFGAAAAIDRIELLPEIAG